MCFIITLLQHAIRAPSYLRKGRYDPIWRKNYYTNNREKVLRQNRESRLRCHPEGYRNPKWKACPRNANPPRRKPTRTCVECGEEFNTTYQTLGFLKSQCFSLCQECMAHHPNNLARISNSRIHLEGKAMLEQAGLFVFNDALNISECEPENDYSKPRKIILEVINSLKSSHAPHYAKKVKKVLLLRFGFQGKELTLRQVAKQMSLTPERIRQIQMKGLRQIGRSARVKELRNFISESC